MCCGPHLSFLLDCFSHSCVEDLKSMNLTDTKHLVDVQRSGRRFTLQTLVISCPSTQSCAIKEFIPQWFYDKYIIISETSLTCMF